MIVMDKHFHLQKHCHFLSFLSLTLAVHISPNAVTATAALPYASPSAPQARTSHHGNDLRIYGVSASWFAIFDFW